MNFIVKIYDWIYGDLTFQRDDFLSIDIKKDISDISVATISSPIFEGIKNLDRVQICSVDSQDVVIFEGFIKLIQPREDIMNISVVWHKSLLQRKYITADITTTSFDSLISSFVSQWTTVWETLSIDREEEFSINWDLRSKWTDIYTILNEVCWTTYAFDFDAINRTISVKKTLGNTIENVYSYSRYHLDNNITSVWLEQSENIRNLSMNFDTGIFTPISENVSEKYGILGIDSWSTDFIGVTKDFSIAISDDSLSAWDSLTLEILSDSYRSYYGSAYVVRENILIEKWGMTKDLEISTIIAKEKTLSQLLRNIQK